MARRMTRAWPASRRHTLRAALAWNDATAELTAAMEANFTKENPIFMMVHSGARGNMTQMRQIAASLPRQAFSPISPGQQLPELEDEIMMQIWDSRGTVIYHSHARSAMPRQAELGFANVRGPNGMWRVYSAQIGNTVVQVAQPQSARDEIAAQMAVKTVAPMLLLFPLIGVLAWLAVAAGVLRLWAIRRARCGAV